MLVSTKEALFMSSEFKSKRIESIDILRGIVMVIMALDHSREYFHFGGFVNDPTDLSTTTPLLFFTRFITHFCAPVFVFLAGTSAYLYGKKTTTNQLSRFLWTRGLWLIFLEVFVNSFFWWFDIYFAFTNLQVLWAIGFSMIIMSFLIKLNYNWLLAIGVVIVFGHNLLDGIIAEGYSLPDIIWYIFHQQQFLPLSQSRAIMFNYSVLPWAGVMILGYCFGKLYQREFNSKIRIKFLKQLGLGSLVAFIIIRGINVYGDLNPWSVQEESYFTFLSFINVTKYPPSLSFILITLGPAMLILCWMDNIKNRFTDFLLVFGRVPLFYYLLHILVIHLAALFTLMIIGDDWTTMILNAEVFLSERRNTHGYDLWVVYLVWFLVVVFLYPLSNWYMKYKARNKDKWWLSYL